VRALLSNLFSLLARAQPAIVVEGTKIEDTALASARSVGVSTNIDCGVGHDR
jgi:hypothetical protein